MAVAFSVVAADDHHSSAELSGAFDRSNRWFLEKHLDELDGDVVLDCQRIEALDAHAIAALRRFRTRASREGRRVVFRFLPPALLARVVRSSVVSSD